mmetsp:Transcript_21873/g.60805  ORF Transcript_21873/g.60805 Transcript_21873/m.60805 type:complete len:106 (+) Transcript_21873:21-338(+)
MITLEHFIERTATFVGVICCSICEFIKSRMSDYDAESKHSLFGDLLPRLINSLSPAAVATVVVGALFSGLVFFLLLFQNLVNIFGGRRWPAGLYHFVQHGQPRSS